MYCSQCGKEMRGDARFCGNCGARAASTENEVDAAPAAPMANGVPAGTAAKKPHLPAIAASVAGLVVIAALLLFASQCTQGSQPQPAQEPAQSTQAEISASSEPKSSSEESPSSEPSPSPEEVFIGSLDGWWTHGARQGIYGDNLSYLHDGTMDAYTATGEFVQTFRTIATDDVARFDNGLGTDGVMGPGWFIYGPNKGESGMYVSDAQPDAISVVHIDGTGYSGGDTLVRVDAPKWADKVESVTSGDREQEAASPSAADVNKIIEGWWVDQGTRTYIKHITGGKVREYLVFDDGTCHGGETAVDVVATRVEEPPALGMADGPGWTLKLTGPDNSLVHYLADSDTETLYCTASDSAAHPEGYLTRMQPSDALASYAASVEGGSADTP